MSMSPKNRAALSNRPKVFSRDYYVYDDRASSLGGIDVVEKDGVRVINLTVGQAQFLLEQGAIGFKPKSELSEDAASATRQFRREKPEEVSPQSDPAPQSDLNLGEDPVVDQE